MQLTNPRRAVVISTLALVLGMAAPVTAFAADDAVDTSEDSQATLVVAPSQDDGEVDQSIDDADDEVIDDDDATDYEGDDAFDDGTVDDADDDGDDAIDDADDEGDDAIDDIDDDTDAADDAAIDDADDEVSDADGTDEDDALDDATDPVTLDETSVDYSDAPTAIETTSAVPKSVTLATSSSAPATGKATTQSVEEKKDEKRNIKDGTYTFSSKKKSSMTLDVVSNKNAAGTNIQLYTSTGASAQKWDIRYVSDGWYRIFKHGTDYALAIAGGAAKTGANIQLAKKSNSNAQMWKFVSEGSGYYSIVSRLSSKFALDIAGGKTDNKTNIQLWKKNGSAAQSFRLYSNSPAATSNVNLAKGTYTIKSMASTSYSLDVKGGSKSSGANVQLHKYNGSQAEKFYFRPDGKGYYIISVIGSGKVLSAKNASPIPGNNVVQSTYSGKDIQKWSLQKTSNGYHLVNKATRLAIDVSGGNYKNGTNIKGSTVSSASHENFKISKVSTLTNGIYKIASIKATSSVFDVKSASTASGAAIQLHSSNDTLAQRFEIVRVNSGDTEIYRIRTAASGGWLTPSGSSVIQSGNHATSVSDANSWQLVWNGNYFSLRNLKTGSVLALKDGKTANGTAIQVKSANKSTAQHFYFTPANLLTNGNYLLVEGVYANKSGDRAIDTNNNDARSRTKTASKDQRFNFTAKGSSGSIYVIKNVYDGRTLSLGGTSKADGTNVLTLSSNTGASSQQWQAKIADGGYIMLVNKYSGKALTVNNGSTSSGANIVQKTIDNGRAQKIKPVHIEWEIKDGKYYYYDASGKKTSGWNKNTYDTWNKIKKMTSGTNYLGSIYVKDAWVHWYIREGNNCWKPYKTFRCTVGNEAAGAATPTGLYHTSGKKGYMGYGSDDSSFYYWTIWNPTDASGWGNGFHSIAYYHDSFRVHNGRLGAHISGGSVRCALENAKWIYDTIKKGTTVYSYR